jgi:hypothetical protein
MARARVALKFFTVGLLVGILFAPQRGAETRQRIQRWITRQPSDH